MTESVSRRNLLKWSGALAAAGVVGIGLGFGGDLLIRPNTSKTVTQTTGNTVTNTTTATTTQTTTVTQPPGSLSYKPPLSPQVQSTVEAIKSAIVARRAGDTVVRAGSYPFWGGQCFLGPVRVHLSNGVITGIENDDSLTPTVAIEDQDPTKISQGILQNRGSGGVSTRTYSYPNYLYRPERLLYPMQKVGARGDPNSQFVRVSWDDAFTAIAAEIQNVITKYGPYSVSGFYTGAFGLSSYLNAGCTGWGIASYESSVFATSYVYGGASGDSQLPDIFNSKLIVLWSVSPTSTGEGGYYIKLAREKGIPVIVVDPKYTKDAEVLADQWIPIKTGTDAAMLIAMANVLFTENIYDQNFVTKFVEPTGFAKWKDYVMGVTDGVSKTPEWQEVITGVPADTVREFARLAAKSKPIWWNISWDMGREVRGENCERAAIYIAALTGSVGISGSYPAGQIQGGSMSSPSRPASPVSISPTAWGGKNATYVQPVLFKNFKWADTVLLRSQLDSGQITKAQYYQTIGNPAANPTPNIKFLWNQTNLINQNVNISKQIAAVKALEMAVSCIWHLDQPTGMISDYILPRAEVFEEDPTFVGAPEGGFVYAPKVIQAPGEVKSLARIMVGLADKLGVLQSYAPNLANLSDSQWDAAMTTKAQTNYETWATANNVTTTWSDFLQMPIYRTPIVTPTVAYSAQITGGKPFGTTSGKIEFYSTYLATTDLTQTKYGGTIAPYAVYQDIAEGYYDPKVTKYPLMCFSPHSRYRMHSWQDGDPMLNTDVYRHSLWINVADANARGIKDGDTVTVSNDVGTVQVPAYVTSKIVPGTVNLFQGGWFTSNSSGVDTRGAPNYLNPDTTNPDGQWPFHGLVEVKKS